MKKVLSLLLSVLMIFSFASAVSAEGVTPFSLTVPYADENGDSKNDFCTEFGTLSDYFVYNYLSPSSSEASTNSELLTFDVENGKTYFYRVSNDYNAEFVTYGAYVTIDENTTSKTVTEDDLMAGAPYNKDTVINDFSENSYDTGDLYLNINKEGHLSLASGDEYVIYPLRNWLPIENSNNSKVIEPDFNFEIIDVDGTGAISIEEDNTDTPSKHSLKLTAENSGTAVVLITYDAVICADAMGGTFLSAIRKGNTGVFVVTVDKAGGIESNIKINEGRNDESKKLAGDSLDAEHDILYYTGDSGASYTFTPEAETQVSLLSPDMSGNSASYGTTFTEVTSSDGTFTLSNLYEGSHIVKLEKGNAVSYQVIKAKRADFQVLKDSTETEFVSPGDEVSIVFDTVYHPANKMSGVYNFTAAISYETPDGTQVLSTPAQYSFATDSAAQTVTLTVPEDFAEDTFTLTNGSIFTDFYGSAIGAHRNITYENGKDANLNAVKVESYLGKLPDISLDVKKTVKVSAYDYTAGGGIILDNFEVTMPNSATAAECAEKAFEDNSIEATGLDTGYISSINGRSEGQGYAGWCFCYNNDDYSNYGMTSVSVKHGDTLRFDYSMNVDTTTDDIGNGWYGNPVITEFNLGNSALRMSKTVSFNDDYSLNISYTYNGTENAVSGSGTHNDPYILNVSSNRSVTLSDASFKTSLNQHYLKYGTENTQNANTILMYISSLGEKYKSWYKISVTVASSYSGGSPSSSPEKEPEQETKPEPKPETKAFSDVKDGVWYKESVDFVTSKGIMNGVSENEFAPQNSMTRCMFVTVLHRLGGEPEAKNTSFADVKSGAYFESAVSWAKENGIAGGVSDTEFAPDSDITREQIAVMIYRFVKHEKGSLGETEALHTSYSDSDNISVWAVEAVSFCKKSGIMTGDDIGNFNPKAPATRAEVAKILSVLSNILTEKEN